jgi:3-oxoacyl-[acyl-carrier-protein] synthase III
MQIEQLELSGIGRIFPPQISSGFIAQLSEALGIPVDRFVDAVGDGPDLFSSSLPYALEFAKANGLVNGGDLGLVISVGSGIQVGCAIYHF